jgi:putative ABC transport system permease protein
VTPPLGRPAPRIGIRLENETLQPSEQTARSVEWYAVSPDYFRTLEIPVMRGRAFDSADRSESRPVAIINAAMAERFWPGEDPIGQRLQTDVIDAPVVEVVGVVGNVRQDRYQRVPQAQLYVPRLQVPQRMDNALALELLQTAVIVRTDGTDGMSATLRAAVQEVFPTLPVSRLRTVEEYASGQVQDLRRATILLSAFGVIATALALIGIVGVVSHAVGQRRFEFGIRMAMGARGRAITSLVIRQGALMIGVGLGFGTLAALGLTRLVGGYLYGVSTLDPISFATALVILAAAGLLASYFPARRAAHIEPVIALRSD